MSNMKNTNFSSTANVIEYVKTDWVDGSNPPLNATNLNKIENALKTLSDYANESKINIISNTSDIEQHTTDISNIDSRVDTIEANIGDLKSQPSEKDTISWKLRDLEDNKANNADVDKIETAVSNISEDLYIEKDGDKEKNFYTKDEVYSKSEVNKKIEDVNNDLDTISSSASKNEERISTIETAVNNISEDVYVKRDDKEELNFYTKNEVYSRDEVYNKEEVYTKDEVDTEVIKQVDTYTATADFKQTVEDQIKTILSDKALTSDNVLILRCGNATENVENVEANL